MSVQVEFANRFIQDPYAFFKLAYEKQPVQWFHFFNVEGWLVTGYKEAEAVLKDARFINEARDVADPEQLKPIAETLMPVVNLTRNMMLFRDAPNHKRLPTMQIVLAVFLIKKGLGN